MLRKKLKDFFIPSLQNRLRPYSLRYGTLVFVILLSVAIELLFFAYVNVAFKQNELLGSIISGIKSTVADILPTVIIEETNAERLKAGAPPLTQNYQLALAAKLKAEDMVRQGYFSHEGPDGSMAWDWLKKANYNYSYAGENLAVNFFDADDVVEAWMNSAKHRENILNKDFKEIGIAAVRGSYEGRETLFVVQMFGTPPAIEPVERYAAVPAGTVTRAVAEGESAVSTTSVIVAGTMTESTTTIVGEIPAVLGATTTPFNLLPVRPISQTERWMVSPRHLVHDVFIILLCYMFLVLVIPMGMIYYHHASANRWLRFKEIFILFKKPIISALVTLACISAVLLINYAWSSHGTNIFQSASGDGDSRKI